MKCSIQKGEELAAEVVAGDNDERWNGCEMMDCLLQFFCYRVLDQS